MVQNSRRSSPQGGIGVSPARKRRVKWSKNASPAGAAPSLKGRGFRRIIGSVSGHDFSRGLWNRGQNRDKTGDRRDVLLTVLRSGEDRGLPGWTGMRTHREGLSAAPILVDNMLPVMLTLRHCIYLTEIQRTRLWQLPVQPASTPVI